MHARTQTILLGILGGSVAVCSAHAQQAFWPPQVSVDSVRCRNDGSASVQLSVRGTWFCPAIPTGARVVPGNVALGVVVEWGYPAAPPCAAVPTAWTYGMQVFTQDLNRSIPIVASFEGPLDLASRVIGNATFDCCVADRDDGSGDGHPDGGVTIDDLLYYMNIFSAGLASADIDDGNGTGTRDGGVTIDDLLFFLDRFAAGC